MIWPLIWLCTVTVVIGVTVPSPFTTIGMAPLTALAVATGIGAPAGPNRPPGASVVRGFRAQASRTSAAIVPIRMSQRRVSKRRQPVTGVTGFSRA